MQHGRENEISVLTSQVPDIRIVQFSGNSQKERKEQRQLGDMME